MNESKNIQDCICCPQCHAIPEYHGTSFYNDVLTAGRIVCPQCGPVGIVCNMKYIFNDNAAFICAEDGTQNSDLREVAISLHGGLGFPADAWRFENGRYWTDRSDTAFRLETSAVGVNVGLLKHNWAGRVLLRVNGRNLGMVDLFEESGSMDLVIPIYLGTGSHVVEVIPTGTANAQSASVQCHVVMITELLAMDGAVAGYAHPPANRGNPYPKIWPELVASMPADALILDCGAGDRRYPDQRVINFEYSAFDAPEVFGDGHKLPFRTGSFDLILSQAVIEHLYNPFVAVEEIRRVLKNGGIVYAESAFMQPLHAVPFHFFNTTRWGIEKLFENFSTQAVASGGGSLSTTLEWIYGLTDLRGKGRGAALDQLLQIARDLDGDIEAAELDKFASFIRVTAVK